MAHWCDMCPGATQAHLKAFSATPKDFKQLLERPMGHTLHNYNVTLVKAAGAASLTYELQACCVPGC